MHNAKSADGMQASVGAKKYEPLTKHLHIINTLRFFNNYKHITVNENSNNAIDI